MDDKQILDRAERAARSVDLPGDRYEDLLRRRDRKRRHQRIAAGVVGMAVFVAAVLVVTSPLFDRTQTPVVPGGAATGPAETGPAVSPSPEASQDPFVSIWDGQGIPPEGTALSAPVEGQPIGQDSDFHHYLVVYADGRVLWWNALRQGGGDYVLERRLTPEGVDLVRSGAIEAEDLAPPTVLHGVPASAWADAEAKPYAPPTYSVCFWEKGGGDTTFVATDMVPAVDLLPEPAKALLRGDDPDPLHPGCLVVSTEEARAFYEILSGMGLDPAWDLGGVTSGATVGAWLLRDTERILGEQVGIYLRPLWPDGDWHAQYLS